MERRSALLSAAWVASAFAEPVREWLLNRQDVVLQERSGVMHTLRGATSGPAPRRARSRKERWTGQYPRASGRGSSRSRPTT